MSSLLNYNTFNISPGKQAYLCCMNEFWASRLKFLARTNCLPLNERLSKINLRSRNAAFERAVTLKTRDPDKTILLLLLFLRIVPV
jgi:hypothetical protein